MLTPLTRLLLALCIVFPPPLLLASPAAQLPLSPSPSSLSPPATVPDIFVCPPLPPRESPPTSIHDLRVDDFSVVMALGDSITAAFSAKGPQPDPIEDIFENRGVSFSMGGDPGFLTLPNLMRRFNPNVTGFSLGDHIAEFCAGPLCPPFQYHPRHDRFNAAQSGAMAVNLMHELGYLVPRVKKSEDVDFEGAWKHLTLFIMSNDLCLSCTPLSPSPPTWLSPSAFSRTLESALLLIRSQIPRTLVTVLLGLNVSGVYDLTKDDPGCAALRHSGAVFECTCAFTLGSTPAGDALRAQMDAQAQLYNAAILELRTSFQPGGRNYDPTYGDTFAVVVEPGMAGVRVGAWPGDMLSGVDCFHPSGRAHAWMAAVMWNNLHLPFADKIRLHDPPARLNWTSTPPWTRGSRHGARRAGPAGDDDDSHPAGVSEVPLWCPTAESRVATT